MFGFKTKPALAGLDQIELTLAIMANPKLFAKHMKELRAIQDENKELIEVAQADLVARLAEADARAAEVGKTAQAEADKTIETAQTEANRLLASMADERKALGVRSDELDIRDNQLKSRAREIVKEDEKLDKREKQTAKELEAVKTLRAELAERKTRFDDASASLAPKAE